MSAYQNYLFYNYAIVTLFCFYKSSCNKDIDCDTTVTEPEVAVTILIEGQFQIK